MGSFGSHSCWELCHQSYKVFTKERIQSLSQPTMPDDEAGGGSPVREQRDPGPRGRGWGLPAAWYLQTQDGATKARPAPRLGVRTPGDGPASRAQAPAAQRDSGRTDIFISYKPALAPEIQWPECVGRLFPCRQGTPSTSAIQTSHPQTAHGPPHQASLVTDLRAPFCALNE